MFGLSWARRPIQLFSAILLIGTSGAIRANAAEPLSPDQLAALQIEAEAAFDRGVVLQVTEPVESKDAFALAAQKYQLLADAQPESGMLYFNLANSYLHSGQVGPAIANYLRAEKLLPGDGRVEAGLQAARTLAGTQKQEPKSEGVATSLGHWNQAIPLGSRMWTGIVAWIVLWSAIAAAMFWPSRRWRFVWAPALVVALITGASVAYQRYTSNAIATGVVTVAQATVRQGNGDAFGPQFSQPLTAGTEFAVLDRRAEWTKIALPDGRSGWLKNQDAAVIE
jgi:tetratricopeptide (TPR) repeat protein